MRINNELQDDVLEYLRRWINTETWDDLAVMIDRGDVELASKHMLNTGAIDPDYCDPENKKIETAIVVLGKRFSKLSHKAQMKRYDAVFKKCFIARCNECNHVSFLDCGNENLYPEVKTECWGCRSKDIETYYWGEK